MSYTIHKTPGARARATHTCGCTDIQDPERGWFRYHWCEHHFACIRQARASYKGAPWESWRGPELPMRLRHGAMKLPQWWRWTRHLDAAVRQLGLFE